MDEQTDPDRRPEMPMPSRWPGSLRLRLGGWTIAVFSVTLAIFTAAGIVEERRQLLRNETDQARAFLEHLARMPEFRGTLETAVAGLGPIRGLLRSTGAEIDLVRAGSDPSGSAPGPLPELRTGVLTSREISLVDGKARLLYRGDPNRYRRIALRSVAIHLLHGLLALVALVAGMEWILRHKLLAPLARISHQVDYMRQGGGWIPILPAMDSELAGLAGAVKNLGPALEHQVRQWVEAERRASVALALRDVRRQLVEPLREARATVGDLAARNLVAPEGKQKLRSILAGIDRVGQVLQAQERLHFSTERPNASEPDRTVPGEESSS